MPIKTSSQTVEHLVDGSVQRLDLILDTQREEGKKQRRNKRTDANRFPCHTVLKDLKGLEEVKVSSVPTRKIAKRNH